MTAMQVVHSATRCKSGAAAAGLALRLGLLAALVPLGLAAAEPLVIPLWPEGAPQPPGFRAEPEALVKRPKDDGLRRPTNVSAPTITLYRPDRANGAAVLVCPGGGFIHLSIENEGTKVCEWLQSLGITAALLKYRVPTHDRPDPVREPLQDAQRALGMLRHRAGDWGIDPQRIGILGFSAGGNIAINAALHTGERSYRLDPAVEARDATPSFAVPIYSSYLVQPDNSFVLQSRYRVTDRSPPMCLIHAHDDRGVTTSSGSALLYLEYKKHGRPAELHIYTHGGHGFGMRPTGHPVDAWPARVEEWFRSMGWIPRADQRQSR